MHDSIRVILPAIIAFGIGIGITPLITYYLYEYKVWKKRPGKQALDGTVAVEFNRLHADLERKVPRMGGIVIWGSIFLTASILTILERVVPSTFSGLDFISRGQTWIPFVTLVVGAVVGLLSDLYDVRGEGKGLALKFRLGTIVLLSGLTGWWMYAKLGIVSVGIPFDGELFIGILVIPAFILLALALYASGVIDGIDGLSGGVFAAIFASYSVIAYVQQQFDIAALSAAILGGILAFLWFNIPPARFYMTETGTMPLTLTIAVIAVMTDTLGGGIGIAVLPVIGFLLVITVLSNIIQVASKRLFGKKVFRIAPLHHHFEALGWPGYKVTMRYWVLAVVLAFIGAILAIVGA